MHSRRSRFRDVLNSVLSSVNAESGQPTFDEIPGIRQFVRQSMEAQFVTLTLEPDWSGGGAHAGLQWQIDGVDSSASLPFQFEEQSDGSLDLLLENWPTELEPLVLLTGNCNFTKFPEYQRTIYTRKSILPPKAGFGGRLAAAGGLTLRGDDGDDWDDDEEDLNRRPLEWLNDGTLHICLHLPNESEPFLAVVEKSWKLESGHTKKVPTTVLMTQDVTPGLWTSTVELDRPELTRDGKIQLTLRPLRESDLKTLPADWTGHSHSMVQEFLVNQKFRTRPIVDADGTDSTKPKKRLRGVDRAAVSNKSTQLHLLAVPAGGKTSAHHPAGATFQKDKVEAELKELRAEWDDSRFADVWVQICPGLCRMLAGEGMDRDLIDDHLQEAFVVLRKHQLQTENDENLVSYLMKAVMNKATDYYRRKKNCLNRGVGYAGDDVADPTASLSDNHHESLLTNMCDWYLPQIVHLTDKEKLVFHYSHVENCSVAQVADFIGLPEKQKEYVRRLQDKIIFKLHVLAGLHLLRPQDDAKANELIAAAASPDPTSETVRESEHMISQLEYDIVFHEMIRGLSSPEVERLLNLHPRERKDLLESTMQKVHAASGALSLAYDRHISQDELDLLEEWLFRKRSVEQLCHEFSTLRENLETALHRLGTLLHGQVLIMTDGKRGPLYKAGREFIEHRIVRQRSADETKQRLIDCKACEPRRDSKTGELKPPVVALKEVPYHVVKVWMENDTLVPRSYCQLHLPEIAETVALAR